MLRRNPRRYDTLLRVRKRREELRAAELASTLREIHAKDLERHAIADEQRRLFEEAGNAARGDIDPARVRAIFQYERYLSRRAIEKDADLRRLERVETERRMELNEAVKQRRIIERLQERLVHLQLLETRKLEQKLSDEIAGNRASASRRMSESP